MNLLRVRFAIALVSLSALSPLHAQVPRSFTCTGAAGTCPRQIDDANAGVAVQTLSTFTLGAQACDGAQATAVSVAVDIKHNRVGDLTLELVPPSGGPVQLIARLESAGGAAGSCHGDDIAATFRDGAAVATCAGLVPAVGGAVRSNGSLAALGTFPPAGVWGLRITDSASGGYGLLANWTLTLSCNISDDIFDDGFE